MKKISFKKITTKEELKHRIENGILHVGAYFNYIRHLLSDQQDESHPEKITVIYNAHYGNSSKDFYI
jgi:hypothetical protein